MCIRDRTVIAEYSARLDQDAIVGEAAAAARDGMVAQEVMSHPFGAGRRGGTCLLYTSRCV